MRAASSRIAVRGSLPSPLRTSSSAYEWYGASRSRRSAQSAATCGERMRSTAIIRTNIQLSYTASGVDRRGAAFDAALQLENGELGERGGRREPGLRDEFVETERARAQRCQQSASIGLRCGCGRK